MTSKLREEIEEPFEAFGRYIVESITLMPTNVSLRKINKAQGINAVITAIINALPQPDLPNTIAGKNIAHGYHMAINDVQKMLEEAKENI